MKKFALLIVAVLVLPITARANQVIWFVAPNDQKVMVVLWKVESVQRSGEKITLRSPTGAITVLPDAEAAVFAGIDAAEAVYLAFDQMLAHPGDQPPEKLAAAQKAIADHPKDAPVKLASTPAILAHDSVIPCASILVEDAFQ